MMQQGGGRAAGGGGGGGIGMGQPRMGMGLQPGANIQEYNPQPQPGGQMAHVQYQQRQQSMNAQSYLGVPQQLVMTQPAVQQQQPPPPAPAKPKEPPGWICPQCTLVNNPRRPGCELCSCARPDDYVIPEEAPLADFEKKAKENEALFEQVKIFTEAVFSPSKIQGTREGMVWAGPVAMSKLLATPYSRIKE